MATSEGKLFRDYAIAIALAVSAALVIRSFLIEAYRIPSQAMRPTLEPGDTIFVGKIPHMVAAEFKRGDIVLFTPPVQGARDYIKRILAIAGDRVQIKQGKLWINGSLAPLVIQDQGACGTERLADGYEHGVCFEPPAMADFGPVEIPQGKVFVMGDQRTRSVVDTRSDVSWGLVDMSTIRGKVLWIWLSVHPQGMGSSGWFPQFRFDRMFRRVH